MTSLITEDLRQLGLARGDDVLVTSDVRFMRLRRGSDGKVPQYAEALLDGLLECVGPSGTVMALAFADSAVLPTQRIHAKPFDISSQPTTGGLAEALVARSGAKRSTHPTNSIAAMGKNAESFVRFHTPSANCFSPVERLVNDGGKLLIVGCVDINPGFSTVHLAQLHLGLSTQNLLSGRIVAKYRDAWGRTRTFHKRDIPGCSLGFSKLYERYRQGGFLVEGTIARAPSMLIDAANSYEVDRRALIEDPTCVTCDNPDCGDCRAFKLYDSAGGHDYGVSAGRLDYGVRLIRRKVFKQQAD